MTFQGTVDRCNASCFLSSRRNGGTDAVHPLTPLSHLVPAGDKLLRAFRLAIDTGWHFTRINGQTIAASIQDRDPQAPSRRWGTIRVQKFCAADPRSCYYLRKSRVGTRDLRSEEHTSELQSQFHLVCPLLLV